MSDEVHSGWPHDSASAFDERCIICLRAELKAANERAERAEATLADVRANMYNGVNEEGTLFWAWLRGNFPEASGATPAALMLSVKADRDGHRSLSESRHRQLEQARDAVEAERAAREKAEREFEREKNAHAGTAGSHARIRLELEKAERERDEARAEAAHARSPDSLWARAEREWRESFGFERDAREKAESEAATLRAALDEAIEGLEMEGLTSTVTRLRAALAVTAGAELLAFARAAYARLNSHDARDVKALALAPSWLRGGG